MDVAFESSGADTQLKAVVQETDEPVQAMIGAPVSMIDQGVMAFEHPCLAPLFSERCEVRIIFPKAGTARAHIRLEPPGVAPMQIPHGGREHYDVPGGQVTLENKLAQVKALLPAVLSDRSLSAGGNDYIPQVVAIILGMATGWEFRDLCWD